jgi:hypothetical protein
MRKDRGDRVKRPGPLCEAQRLRPTPVEIQKDATH